ncbi:MAG: VIT family protein [Brevundimonas sp.]|nr:MAG: VIT family protein [Brevundimonas sp.]
MAILTRHSGRVLEPIDRVSEVLFGLIMVLTFTGSLSVVDAGRDDVHAMLIGALGCNLAWAIIDAVLYLMFSGAANNQGLATVVAVRDASDPRDAHRLIAETLPPVLADSLQPADLESIRARLATLPEPPPRIRLGVDDLRGAGGVFLLVFLSTFPVTIPFMIMHSVEPAMRVSNAIAIGLLFLTGYAFGRITGRRPLWTGFSMVVLGAGLVGLTIALGG